MLGGLAKRPSQLTFVHGNLPKTFHFPAEDATFRTYYAPRPPYILEPEVVALTTLLLPNNGVFFDIGSNWGFHTAAVALRQGFKGKIHTFEVNPPTIALAKNIFAELGILGKPVTLHPHGLSHTAGTTTLGGAGRTGDSSTVQVGRADGLGGGVTAEIKRLDDLKLDKPDFIKLDVEGHELEVLQGAEQTLTTARPLVVFESWSPKIDPNVDTTYPVLRWFTAHNFALFRCGWLQADGEVSEHMPTATATFVLEPLTATSRATYPQMLNILAVPQEKLAQVEKLFTA